VDGKFDILAPAQQRHFHRKLLLLVHAIAAFSTAARQPARLADDKPVTLLPADQPAL
jgi:hypothetical protein